MELPAIIMCLLIYILGGDYLIKETCGKEFSFLVDKHDVSHQSHDDQGKETPRDKRSNMVPYREEAFTGQTSGDIPKVNLAILVPFAEGRPFSLHQISPSVELALEVVGRLGILTYHLQARYADSKCSSTNAPIEAIEFHMRKEADVFLGPVCDYALAPVARYSPYWNIPIVTPGGMAADFRNKDEYSLLTRIGASYDGVANSLIAAFNFFNFSKIKILYTSNGSDRSEYNSCHLAISALVQKMRREETHEYDFHLFTDREDTRQILEREIGVKYSVIVLCASPDSVRNIMIKAAELGFDNGEYVFFNIDLFSSKNQSEQPWHRDNDTQDRNRLARQAYEALMTVTLRKPDSLEYKKFSEEVKRRAQQQYGNFTYGKEEVNSFVGAFHDAVILYAIALNETLAAGYNATDGAEITKRMWNRSFEGITGTVSIDENGDRNADYSLLDFNPRSNKFEVVANYYGNRKKYEPVKDKIIFWPGGRHHPPPDTPKCGFDGSGCPSKDPAEEEEGVDDLLEQPGDTENPPNEYTEIC